MTRRRSTTIYWLLYGALVVFRVCVGPHLHGYLHPDELFQSGQEIWYGHPPMIAWEFEPENALRSVLAPGIMTGIPLQLYGMATGDDEFSGQQVLLIPRFACALLSLLTVDWSIWRVLVSPTRDHNNKSSSSSSVPLLPMLLLASSWPTMVLLNRPFSNTLETCMVALLVASVLASSSSREKTSATVSQCIRIGMICALGLFTRFTFVFFAIPPMLLFLHDLLVFETTKRNAIKKIMATAMAFFGVSIAIVVADTLFYSSDYFAKKDVTLSSLSIHKDVVVTPWNALRYNSKVSNLQEHGLHPRWTHGLVNMFILFGPLTLWGYWNIIILAGFFVQKPNSSTTDNETATQQQQQQQSNRITKLACCMVVSGLGFLSLAPHQEPRFLLPLLVPLVLLARNNCGGLFGERRNRRSLQVVLAAAVWIVFNLILFTLFGALHQSGVVPSLLDLGQVLANKPPPSAILYYHTYMPPSFLLRNNNGKESKRSDEACVNSDEESAEGHCETLGTFGTLVDLKGSDWATLEKALETQLECDTTKSSSNGGGGDYVILVMPTMIQNNEENKNDQSLSWSFTPDTCKMPTNLDYECGLLPSYANHLSTEDLPPFGGSISQFYRNMALNVYEISCSSYYRV